MFMAICVRDSYYKAWEHQTRGGGSPNKMSFSGWRRHLQISAILISMNLISNSVTTQYVHDCHGGSQPATPHPWIL